MDVFGIEPAGALPLLVAMLLAALAAGFLAGLLGVGGGIVLVPVLDAMLVAGGTPPEQALHVAVATSLATIIPTSLSSARAHHRRGAVDVPLARRWAVAMLVGAALGAVLASRAPAATLSLVFGLVALAAAVRMMIPVSTDVPSRAWPLRPAGQVVATVIGAVSATMGIGGGTVSVPVLSLSGIPVHRAVGTSSVFGLVIAVAGTAAYLLAAVPHPTPWSTVGWVNLAGVALIAPLSVVMAPLGVAAAHGLSRRRLTLAFGLFLSLVAARMLYRTIAGGEGPRA
jgi:uncharacterized membrane protein YfcA